LNTHSEITVRDDAPVLYRTDGGLHSLRGNREVDANAAAFVTVAVLA
jgi:hypothetical protein